MNEHCIERSKNMICKKFFFLLLTGLVIFSTQSCFYSFKGSLPAHIRSIAIPLFENQTAEYQINETITDLLLAQFLQEGVLRVADEDDADSILDGAVRSINDTPYTYDEAEQVEEYRVTIGLAVTWYDVVEDEVRLEENISGFGVYDAQESEVTREDAIEEAVAKITDKIINSITASW